MNGDSVKIEMDLEYQHLYGKAKDVALDGEDTWHVLSTSEQLAVAMIFNRFDWLTKAGYSMPEAVRRIGPEWMALIPPIARELRDDGLMPKD